MFLGKQVMNDVGHGRRQNCNVLTMGKELTRQVDE